ncbi:MAG: hypothetical protein AMXMBFR48_01350 [Ignavibacteriales bacterium]
MRLPENILWALWEHAKFKNEVLHNDHTIRILKRGTYTGDFGGPDYADVSVSFNGSILTGSLEIDSEQSGWISHGHSSDPAFNSCILHIHGGNSGSESVTNSRGGNILSLPIGIFFSENIHFALAELLKSGKLPSTSPLICSDRLEELDSEFLRKYFYELAIERFQKKCKRFSDLYYNFQQNISFLYSLNPDAEFIWKYTISAMVFRAMGYSANSSLMEDLFSMINPAFLIEYSGREDFSEYLETYVWELSGLLPELSEIEEDSTISYIRSIKERWEEIRKYLNASRISKYQWKTRMLRPGATVHLRIYTAVQIVAGLWKNGFSDIFHQKNNSLTQKEFASLLKGYLQVEAGNYWSLHNSFTKRMSTQFTVLPGDSRIQEILINVFLPGLYSYFSVIGNATMKELCRQGYLEMKLKSNPGIISKILKEVLPSEKPDSAVYYQGAVELSTEFCKKGRCDECKIGERVFS